MTYTERNTGLVGANHALPAGFVLNEYRVESVLGTGGFGVTYLATDCNLNLRVALKEYLPVDFAARAPDHSISARTDADNESFEWGLRRFLDEARTLASFHHPNIVRVMRFFEGNRTGYMVMEFVDGQPLSQWIEKHRPIPQQSVLDMVGALLGGINVMHRAGYLHRDIKPSNIFIRADSSPVLIDFGSARSINNDTGLTAMVSPGYAPLEQYHSHGRQGPWSDLYALGGVMYWMITGSRPVEAAARVRDDVMRPARAMLSSGLYTADFLEAIDWALMPHEDERPQSTAAFHQRLGIAARDTTGRHILPLEDSPRTHVESVTPTAVIGRHTHTSGGSFDADLLKRIETEAARTLGPIAAVLVRKAARKAITLADLCEAVAREIEDEKARAAFLRKFAHDGHTAPPTHPPTHPRSMPAASISAKFTPEILKRIETELARHIGAIASVVIRRAAAKARDEAELYLLIADEIQDPAEKKMFVRKAVTASRRL
jgi:serine/threonine protein kinase